MPDVRVFRYKDGLSFAITNADHVAIKGDRLHFWLSRGDAEALKRKLEEWESGDNGLTIKFSLIAKQEK